MIGQVGKRLLLCALSAACSDVPTNFAGDYTMTLVNGPNDCNFQDWTQGSTSNVTATISQSGSNATVTFTNALTALYLDALLGTHVFSGTVTASELKASYVGGKSIAVSGTACTYTVDLTLDMTLDANGVLSGTVTIVPVTNRDASCGATNTCTSNVDTVSGARTSP